MEDSTTKPSTPSSPVIPMTLETLPPGFVASGPPMPYTSPVSAAGVPLPPSTYGGSTVGPAGVPLPSSIYSGTPARSDAVIAEVSGAPVVIPRQPSSRSSGSSRAASAAGKEPYTRSAARRRAADEDSDSSKSVSSGMGSSDSLTTPPARTRKLSSVRSGGGASYAAAPVPANVNYPTSPLSNVSTSLPSQSTRAARVPLPPSVSGGSVVGSMMNSVAGAMSRAGSVLAGARAASEMAAGMTRPKSPLAGPPRSPRMDAARTLSCGVVPGGLPFEPVIPIPIPEPTPITSPIQIPK